MRRRTVIAVAFLLVVGGAVSARAQEPRPAPGGPGGTMGPGGMMGMRRGDHLEHLVVHDPKAAARVMRFRAEMLRAMSEALQRQAAQLEKAQ